MPSTLIHAVAGSTVRTIAGYYNVLYSLIEVHFSRQRDSP
jgi:hypothetical protein